MSSGTPNRYKDVCQKALDVRAKYNLTDTQTLLYNHICRKDLYLHNEDGQLLYDENNNGFGWSGSREWVKRQFKVLVKAGLVKFETHPAPRDARYRIWYWFDSEAFFEDLVNATSYATVFKFFCLKKYFNLPDGFDRNGTYGDLRLSYTKKPNLYYDPQRKGSVPFYNVYTFEYKDYKHKYIYDNFARLVHSVSEVVSKEDKVDFYNDIKLDSTTERLFTIEDHLDL